MAGPSWVRSHIPAQSSTRGLASASPRRVPTHSLPRVGNAALYDPVRSMSSHAHEFVTSPVSGVVGSYHRLCRAPCRLTRHDSARRVLLASFALRSWCDGAVCRRLSYCSRSSVFELTEVAASRSLPPYSDAAHVSAARQRHFADMTFFRGPFACPLGSCSRRSIVVSGRQIVPLQCGRFVLSMQNYRMDPDFPRYRE